MADFALLKSPTLISRNIWVIEKSWNFHTGKLRVLANWAVVKISTLKVQNSMPVLFRFTTLYNYEKCQKSPWPIHVIMMFDDFRVTKSTLTNFTTWELASFKPCQVWSKVLLMNRMIPTLITKLLLRKIKEWRLQGIHHWIQLIETLNHWFSSFHFRLVISMPQAW